MFCLNELLTPYQFGFWPKLSTVTALAHFTNNILQSLDKGGFTGAVFLDLSKAFDTVDHVLLNEKFKTIGKGSFTGGFTTVLVVSHIGTKLAAKIKEKFRLMHCNQQFQKVFPTCLFMMERQ